MSFPLTLYELRPYDLSDPRWSPLYFAETISGAATATTSGTPQSPEVNKLWLITGIYAALSPQAAVFALNCEVRINAGSPASRIAIPFAFKWPTGDLAAGETVSESKKVDCVIIGGTNVINVIWQWSAGNAANIGNWSFVGYEIPRGNISLR